MLKVKTASAFLVRENKGDLEVCLARGKSKSAQGKWITLSTKFDPDYDRTIAEALSREIYEGYGLEIDDFEEVGRIRFRDDNKINDCHVYIIKGWGGEFSDGEGFEADWFNIDSLPLGDMLAEEELWVPDVLKYQKHFAAEIVKSGDSVDWTESWIDWEE